MADISEFIRKYANHKTTFKITSFDSDNNESLCLDESQENINFDEIIADIYPNPDEYRPKSFDSIYINNNDIYCIEFKNEKKPNKKDVEQKLLDGKYELDKLFGELNIQKRDYRFVFCLVYNKSVQDYQRYKREIQNYDVKMYLSKCKEDGLVSEIVTEDVNFFTKQFRKKFGEELICD